MQFEILLLSALFDLICAPNNHIGAKIRTVACRSLISAAALKKTKAAVSFYLLMK
ncbi:MAG: hypothetical protein L6V93_23445 [Clostridiales bacterium]|nr:MAG: hypothetical protein L6V93_23445 [Clostridiales bacterium]